MKLDNRSLYICNIVVFFILTAYSSYRRIVALVLLGIAIFIATPVQFLHTHSNSATSQSEHSNESKAIVKKLCTICSFEYETANDDAAVVSLPAKPFIYTSFFDSYQNTEDRYILNLSNKSPPAFL
jgi:hypothetical protein